MKWISEFVNLDGVDIRQLIQQFTLSTAEVEDIIEKGKDIDKVVVAEIKKIENIEDSSKLHLLTLDAGNRICHVVCGAPNVQVGLKVPFAMNGGRIPAKEIKACQIHGIYSEGMCCSEAELDIGLDNSGLMVLPAHLENGTDIKSVFNIDDIIFEVDNKSLTNRPDLWGHYGIAREFSALTHRPLAELPVKDFSQDEKNLEVKILREDLVYRYSCVKIENISCSQSPINMRIRLHYCGMRSINLLTDLTNYVMLEIGQPLHAFDGSKINKIVIGTPDNDIEFETLDGQKRQITPTMLMIYDEQTPIAIAGVMGGLDSGICDSTNSVVLESANFDGVSIRKTSAQLALRTDASMRFEKILDPELTKIALTRIYELLSSIDNKIIVTSNLTDIYMKHYENISLNISDEYIRRYTGIDICGERVVEILNSLGFSVLHKGANYQVEVPTWRATKDVTIEADLIEEVSRIYGYDNFVTDTTRSILKPISKDVSQKDDETTKDLCVLKYGMHEVHSYIWCDSKNYKRFGIEVEENPYIMNMVNSESGVLRNSLIPTLLSFVYDNRTYADDFSIFEIARVIKGLRQDGNCDERKHLGIVSYSRTQNEKTNYLKQVEFIVALVMELKRKEVSFVKSSNVKKWQSPKNNNDIICDGLCIGSLFTLYPRNANLIDKNASIVCIEIDMDAFSKITPNTISYVEPSKYPQVDYDLSLVVPVGMKFSDLCRAWEKEHSDILQNVYVIDEYNNGGIRSLTIRYTMQAWDRTLTSVEVQTLINKFIYNLNQMGIQLRS